MADQIFGDAHGIRAQLVDDGELVLGEVEVGRLIEATDEDAAVARYAANEVGETDYGVLFGGHAETSGFEGYGVIIPDSVR